MKFIAMLVPVVFIGVVFGLAMGPIWALVAYAGLICMMLHEIVAMLENKVASHDAPAKGLPETKTS